MVQSRSSPLTGKNFPTELQVRSATDFYIMSRQSRGVKLGKANIAMIISDLEGELQGTGAPE